MAVLDDTCAWLNPGLVLVAVAIALLDLTAAAQRWTVVRPAPPASATIIVITDVAKTCSPVLAPELRDMAGRD